jgi:hypothetical protein
LAAFLSADLVSGTPVVVWPLDMPANAFVHSLFSSLDIDRNGAGKASPTASAALKTTNIVDSCILALLNVSFIGVSQPLSPA